MRSTPFEFITHFCCYSGNAPINVNPEGRGSGIGWGLRHFLNKIIKIPTLGQKIMVKSIIYKWCTSLLLFIIERSNDQNPHPGDTQDSQILVGCPLGLDIDRCIMKEFGLN